MVRVRSGLTVIFRNDGLRGVLAGAGPVGRFVTVLPAVGKGAQGVDEVAYRGEGSAADGLLRDDAETDLDELEPRVGVICSLSFSGAVWDRSM
jgi:hypothetical protein